MKINTNATSVVSEVAEQSGSGGQNR
ncbi:hypothetical protein BCD_1172 (plasmid) [Borrelia crocidurae DOU]|uniref:Uncharacterized protein n=1 Tax=Borrelia crocidurae DOU TaxID=1293575 RepID=W5SKQ1_9SPIR|nr:hypothetical protein BCD_1172 [Borrelia crocidurae DOU]